MPEGVNEHEAAAAEPAARSIKFYENAARLAAGVFDGFAEGEAVLLGALAEAAGDGDADGEAGDDQDGQDGDWLLHHGRDLEQQGAASLLIVIIARFV
jgi:hypothetical protein